MLKLKVAETSLEKEQAFDVRRRVFTDEQGVSPDIEFDEWDKTAVHFIGYNLQQPIAAGRLRIIEQGIGKAERICVLPEFRGHGIGAMMMTEAEEYARTQKLHIVRLNAQVHALPFYENLGYTTVSEEFLSAGIPHKTMEKTL
ncbi:GNAT family N-acetyltransferase [Planococcus lenghuensis]|uniref:GNAT family N-acetyltransferase n=1 Tax=Planococcus lenghuensis TaxID=2213202 RepID=A0A1Q2L0G7_9BACL|nr:GNAT family N-acetyltransferase [Planococcus lenghuensis]AQQ53896.1 GNAT family N-acetyltransferase [Planococcus lenghuensis]